MPNGPRQPLLLSPWLYASVLVSGLVAINLILFTGAYSGDHVDADKAGVLGDFVGGYIGAYIALLSGMGLLYTLALQRQLLQQQAAENSRQQQQDAIQRFEAKYFELIRLHRENVAEMRLGRHSGRKVFLPILNEIRLATALVRRVAKACSHDISDVEAVRVAYTAVFFGVGANASPMLAASLSKHPPAFVRELDDTLRRGATRKRSLLKSNNQRGPVPFQGHQSRLGHYYRHLFQAIKYVDSHEVTNTLGADAKRGYAKTIRAQLSTHEQAVLLINALSDVGREWWDQKYLSTYGLVKNLPRNFLGSMRLDMGMLFKPNYFEWEQNPSGPLTSDTGHVIAS